jgi:hypothetical protein
MALAGFTDPFPGSEPIMIELTKDWGLYRVTSVPLFCDEPCIGDIVTLDIKTMQITEVITPGGRMTHGGLFDPEGGASEIRNRFRQISEWLAKHDIPSRLHERGIFVLARPLALTLVDLETLAALSPREFKVHTRHARYSAIKQPCPGCGYIHGA